MFFYMVFTPSPYSLYFFALLLRQYEQTSKGEKMLNLISPFKKVALVFLVFAIGQAYPPAAGVSAASLQDVVPPVKSLPAGNTISISYQSNLRLERIWSRRRAAFQLQGDRLTRADDIINRVQSLIDKADQKGRDTSTIQVSLDAFQAVIPAAQTAHEPGIAIIADHKGFDAYGKVTDHVVALETVQSLDKVLKDTHTAMNRTGQALLEAIRAFHTSHHPTPAPTAAP
jgi:hypothetical protein